MKHFVPGTILLIPFIAHAADPKCSIHPPTHLADPDLQALARISLSEAQGAALKAAKADGATIDSGELEAEHGCLIYSFDIKVPGQKSIIEVGIDAGDGKVLWKALEGPQTQAAEERADRAAAK